MRELRVLVTGSRHLTEDQAAHVQGVLQDVRFADLYKNGRRPIVIVQGECPNGGVDLAAKQWAEQADGATSEGHPADWERHGKSAGPIRNSYMVSLGADLCLAFPATGSRGTWDCIRKAVDAGIPTRIHPLRTLVPREHVSLCGRGPNDPCFEDDFTGACTCWCHQQDNTLTGSYPSEAGR